MTGPYYVLGLPRDADDATIRRAYLDAVKRHPPEVDPEHFRNISEAYERIKDEAARDDSFFNDRGDPIDSPGDALLQMLRSRPPHPPSGQQLLAHIRRCAQG